MVSISALFIVWVLESWFMSISSWSFSKNSHYSYLYYSSYEVLSLTTAIL